MKRFEAQRAVIGGLVLAALLGCDREPSVATKSAAAFREAQKRGEKLEGDGHAHGHGAVTPGGGQTAPDAAAADPHAGHGEEPPAGHDRHDHGAAEAPAAGGEHDRHGAAGAKRQADHGDHAAMGHGPRDKPGATPHAGHGTAAPQALPSGTQSPHAGHAGHAPSGGAAPAAPSAPAPVAVPREQPAKTLRPDALDAPAATSVADAQRAAELSREMGGDGHGGHGGHGGTYSHVDAGRGPAAHEGSQPQTPGAGPQHHDHGASSLYVCPMHPEVTSTTPGTCPKCGMTLVERRKE